ncbi:hypothetical protein G6F23_013903 [Rhizopus arrhizus]|nr:hypothetical protein G6F23_013903 [Rhizopus arrhizus]
MRATGAPRCPPRPPDSARYRTRAGAHRRWRAGRPPAPARAPATTAGACPDPTRGHALQLVHIAQEAVDERRGRPLPDLARRADLLDAAGEIGRGPV